MDSEYIVLFLEAMEEPEMAVEVKRMQNRLNVFSSPSRCGSILAPATTSPISISHNRMAAECASR